MVPYDTVHLSQNQMVAQELMGLVAGRCLGLFYNDDKMVGSWDPECLQGALNVIICLFCKNRLVMNVANYKPKVLQPGALRFRMLEEAVVRWFTGRGVT